VLAVIGDKQSAFLEDAARFVPCDGSVVVEGDGAAVR